MKNELKYKLNSGSTGRDQAASAALGLGLGLGLGGAVAHVEQASEGRGGETGAGGEEGGVGQRHVTRDRRRCETAAVTWNNIHMNMRV